MCEMDCTHKVYGYVTEDEFYAGLNEAKKENLFIDEKGRVDIGKLIRLMWEAFGEGRMAIVPKEGFHRPKKEIEPTVVENLYPIGEKVKISLEGSARDQMEGVITGIYKAGTLAPEEIYEIEFSDTQKGQFKHTQFSLVAKEVKKPARKRTKPAEVKAEIEPIEAHEGIV